ncbi:NUDIX hydrolase domain-containingprotein [Apiospora rasikravindrae]|uniref:NUDIX hydrolase domain-containingprotein n=1 Tax=Apiospora rasikravindrae TaxID=990691 RepID=A0ABR1RNR5_9PEZI
MDLIVDAIDDKTSCREYDKVIQRLDRRWEIEKVNEQPYDAEDWKDNNDTAVCYDMKSLMMSFGTVTIREKPGAGGPQVLIFFNAKHKSYQLPKGRRNLHEDPADAALRETLEETGVEVEPLYLGFDTRIVLDHPETAIEDVGFVRQNENGTVTAVNRDVLYAMSYDDKKTGAHRHIYFYAAQPALGDGEPDAALLSGEDRTNKVHWFGFEEARRKLTMRAEREAVIAAQILYRRTRDNKEWWDLSKELLEKWKKNNAARRVLTGQPLARAVASDPGKAAILAEAIKKIVPDGGVEAAALALDYLKRLGAAHGNGLA